ncbi:hypothetical protein LMG27198_31970 [Methylocystis echinoides]|uniref:Uncharacterized protein n=1 Tax=Methylocystis echinoides TaxID=29468 RepID=A0A9W6LSZ3_9HYPH|nr:hypothetical protein LMG27198_31970 [Methylocystis echinoides]
MPSVAAAASPANAARLIKDTQDTKRSVGTRPRSAADASVLDMGNRLNGYLRSMRAFYSQMCHSGVKLSA